MPQFHLAFPVRDLEEAATFYSALGASPGRQNSSALILDFFGHQIVAHRSDDCLQQSGIYPRHFGVIFEMRSDLERLAALARSSQVMTEQRRRYGGKSIAHETLIIRDPSGNVLEFKCYDDPAAIFGLREIGLLGDTRPE